MIFVFLITLLFVLLQVYLKPHFNYNPNSDNLIPCKEAGLAFSKGEILHVVNKEDTNWWQVRGQMWIFGVEEEVVKYNLYGKPYRLKCPIGHSQGSGCNTSSLHSHC